MANLLNLPDHSFTFRTKNLGELKVRSITTAKVMKDVENSDDLDAKEFVRLVAAKTCETSSDQSDSGLSVEQQNLLVDKDLENFARLAIENNPDLKKIRTKDENDHTQYLDSDDRQKRDNETYSEHLQRLLTECAKDFRSSISDIFKNLLPFSTSRFFSDGTLNLFKENQRLSSNLRTSLKFPPLDPAAFKNPVEETNSRLKTVEKELNGIGSLLSNMNDLNVQLVQDNAKNAASATFWNRVIFTVGLLTLIFTAGMSYLNYSSNQESYKSLEQFLNQTNSNLERQLEAQELRNTRLDTLVEMRKDNTRSIGSPEQNASPAPDSPREVRPLEARNP